MIDKRVVIAIMARDCRGPLEKNIPRIEQLRGNFKSSSVVVVENDSKDGTKELLKKWALESENINLIMNDYGTVTIPSTSSALFSPLSSLYRIEKMARYRNLYIDYIKAMELSPDYLIVVDIDVEFSVDGLLTAMSNAPSDWGALFANGSCFWHGLFPYFFDIFAYLPLGTSISRTNGEMFQDSKILTKRLRKENYIECCSAFGGLGVYKWSCVKNAEYRTSKNERSQINEAICEHVSFNMAVVDSGYKNYICKDMKVDYGNKRTIKHLLIYSIMPIQMYMFLYKIIKRKDYVG